MTNNSTWKKLLLFGFCLQFCLIFYLLMTTSAKISCPACQPTSCPVCETHIERHAASDTQMKQQSNLLVEEPPPRPVHQTSTHLNYYSLSKFAHRGWMFPVETKLCVNTKRVEVMKSFCVWNCISIILLIIISNWQPNFIICAHDPSNDIYVSKSIISDGYWERDMAQWLSAFVTQIESDTLYIDLGANLGIHGLHAAKSNCTVWAVEPQEQNLQKVLSNSTHVQTNKFKHSQLKADILHLCRHKLF